MDPETISSVAAIRQPSFASVEEFTHSIEVEVEGLYDASTPVAHACEKNDRSSNDEPVGNKLSGPS